MPEDTKPKLIDQATVTLIGHICIRDPDSGEIILRQRDIEKKKNEPEN